MLHDGYMEINIFFGKSSALGSGSTSNGTSSSRCSPKGCPLLQLSRVSWGLDPTWSSIPGFLGKLWVNILVPYEFEWQHMVTPDPTRVSPHGHMVWKSCLIILTGQRKQAMWRAVQQFWWSSSLLAPEKRFGWLVRKQHTAKPWECCNYIYPLANCYLKLWKDPPCYFHGKINYFDWAIFSSIFQFANCSSLPEGTLW
jgi:hypothetical protein